MLLDCSNYFIWIRDPIKRYISAFNHSKEIATFDVSLLKGQKPSFDNCQAPQRIQIKIDTGRAYPEEYENLLKRFDSANHLAESLTGLDGSQKKFAMQLMNYPLEHIYKGIGWYLDNGKFVDINRNKILFCGSVENMQSDFDLMVQKHFNEIEEKPVLNHVRMNKSALPKKLSKKAKENIFSFYKETDYQSVERLVDNGLVHNELLDLYMKNANWSE